MTTTYYKYKYVGCHKYGENLLQVRSTLPTLEMESVRIIHINGKDPQGNNINPKYKIPSKSTISQINKVYSSRVSWYRLKIKRRMVTRWCEEAS
jgi:hypothetical protein